MAGKELFNKRTNISELANEWIYRRYLMGKEQFRNLFTDISVPGYVVLYIVAIMEADSEISPKKTYLKDIAAKMELAIPQLSPIIEKLNDRGLLVWSHDGNGSGGTYVTLTDSGYAALTYQEEALKAYFGRVIELFGKANFIQLLKLMKQLEDVMNEEINELN